MNRMLIIDDEPYIVDSLYELFSEVFPSGLEIIRAYTTSEAISHLNTNKVDIVLSDINMPGKTGLDLLEEIKRKWPACKVVFLTGYDNFQYVQSAIRLGGADYILKTEDEDVIVQAIKKVLISISNDKAANLLVKNARQQLDFVKPHIKKELLLDIIVGSSTVYSLNDSMVETILSVDREIPCFLVLGRIDSVNASEHINQTQEVLTVEKMGGQLLDNSYLLEMVNIDKFHFCWLIQSRTDDNQNLEVCSILNVLNAIQDELSSVGITVSFISSTTTISWDELSTKYRQLETISRIGTSHRKQLLLTEEQYYTDFHQYLNKDDKGIQTQTKKLNQLSTYLESGKQIEFNQLFKELKQINESSPYPVYKEVYYVLVASMMTQANRLGLGESFLDNQFYRSLDDMKHAPRTEAFNYLYAKFGELLELQNEIHEDQPNEIVTQIQQYIHENIQHDISLGKLGEMVYLNPQYLCRVYKQETGIGLSEYIAEVRLKIAKELLRETHLKVHEVAKEIGIESAAYFNRFFKKFAKITPLEYRGIVKKD